MLCSASNHATDALKFGTREVLFLVHKVKDDGQAFVLGSLAQIVDEMKILGSARSGSCRARSATRRLNC